MKEKKEKSQLSDTNTEFNDIDPDTNTEVVIAGVIIVTYVISFLIILIIHIIKTI